MNTGKLVVSAMICAAIGLLALPAQADSGIYIGGGVAQAKIEDSAGNPGGTGFSESDVGGKLFAGYRLDAIPLLVLAAEVGYRDLGNPNTTTGGVNVDYKLHGLDYAALAGVSLGPVDVFGKVGGMQYKLQKNIGAMSNDYDGTAPVYGVGVWLTLFGLGVRAEYEQIDVKELDKVEVISVSATYKF